ncbi:hypothetical protein BOTBODRAFT_47839 [Botryobasidium botryosum FD-172 SS1]|uniref:Uncharacterized protein n=1 Tax=Botryobasidium botryosum (strain FD-172 SS1) TaxID=930990 RepID=A0A067LZU7_BOTB1|nr:hypothetical protein BOTBODRAFT_47839 [Botryobasidium botryosum FD-172 SS1]
MDAAGAGAGASGGEQLKININGAQCPYCSIRLGSATNVSVTAAGGGGSNAVNSEFKSVALEGESHGSQLSSIFSSHINIGLLAKAEQANNAQQPNNLPKNKDSNMMLSLHNATVLLVWLKHANNEFRLKNVETLGKLFQVPGTKKAPSPALVHKDKDKSKETEMCDVQGIPESNKWGLCYDDDHDKIEDPDAKEECTEPKVFEIEAPAPTKLGIYWIEGKAPVSFNLLASSKSTRSRLAKSGPAPKYRRPLFVPHQTMKEEVLKSKCWAEALKCKAEEERKRKELEQQERENKECAEKE